MYKVPRFELTRLYTTSVIVTMSITVLFPDATYYYLLGFLCVRVLQGLLHQAYVLAAAGAPVDTYP